MRPTSVRNKAMQMIKAFNEMGWETKGLFVSHNTKEVTELDEFCTTYPSPRVGGKLFVNERQHRRNTKVCHTLLREHASDADLIYFRYPRAGSQLLPLVKEFGRKIVFEHNTMELGQMRMHIRLNPFALKPTRFLDWFRFRVLIYERERYWGPRVFKHVKLGLVNTHESKAYQQRRCASYQVELQTNGINVSRFPAKKPLSFDGSKLNLLLMRGSRGHGYYDGVDRLLQGMKAYAGSTLLHLYLVGNEFEREQSMAQDLGLSDSVTLTGPLYGDDLTAIIDQCHLSIGTLALHRKDMSQASVLRVNESITRGLPVVIGYHDMEVCEHEEYAPFYHRIPADDALVDVNELVQFAEKVCQSETQITELRSLAKKNLDYSVKLAQLKLTLQKHFELHD